MTATVNTSRAVSVRLVTPSRGAWFADVDLDPDDASSPPSGIVTLTVAGTAMSGQVDPRGSGRFASSVRLRIVGGAGGWDKPVPSQHFHNDAGVSSSTVYQATAGEVGEAVNDPAPFSLGVDYVRSGGAASRVFGERDWFVDLAGVTQVGARPAASPDASLEVLSYDARAQRVDVASDGILLPGTALQDARFDGTLTVRDVEQTFDTNGSRAIAWCGAGAVSRLTSALANMVKEFSGRTYLGTYLYRFITASSGRLNIQAVDASAGLPDLLPLSVFPGSAGLSSSPTPSQGVLVAFLEGDPSKPIVVGFDATLPVKATIDATAEVDVGPSAVTVSLAGGNKSIARVGDAIDFSNATITAPSGGGPCVITPTNPLLPAFSVQTGSSKAKA